VLASVAPPETPSCEVSAAAIGSQPTGEVRRRVGAESPEMRLSMLKLDTVTLERSRRGRCTFPLTVMPKTLIISS